MKRSLLVLFFLIAFFAAFLFIGFSQFSLTDLRVWLDSFGVFAPLAYVIGYVVATLCFIPVTPFVLVAGILFGSFWGGVYTTLGMFFGALFAFLLADCLRPRLLHSFFAPWYKRFAKYDQALAKRGFLTVLLLRLSLVIPFGILNYCLGLSAVRLAPYLIGTSLGTIPVIFAYTYFGEALFAGNPMQLVFSGCLLLVFILFISRELKRYT